MKTRMISLAGLVLLGSAGAMLGLLTPVLTGKLFGSVIPHSDRVHAFAFRAASPPGAGAVRAFSWAAGLNRTRPVNPSGEGLV